METIELTIERSEAEELLEVLKGVNAGKHVIVGRSGAILGIESDVERLLGLLKVHGR